MTTEIDNDFEMENEFMGQVFENARKEGEEKKCAKAMEDARTVMVMGQKPEHVFFASLVCKLRYEPCWDIPTAATDGVRMLYNPDFMLKFDKAGIRFIHAHEVMHCVYGHVAMGKRLAHLDQKKLNIAMDLVINWVLKEAGYQVIDCALMPGKGDFAKIPPNLTTLETYRLITDKMAQNVMGPDGDPGGMGGIMPLEGEAGSESATSALEQDWKIKVAQATNAAKMRGTISANLQRIIDLAMNSKVNWREVLRDFATKATKNVYTWSPPNKRFLSNGLYLPRMGGQTLAGLVIANDTSGSMDMGPRSKCAAEIQAIAEMIGCDLTILHHDSRICSVQQWSPADGILKLEPRGGGGTSHMPVFEWIKDNVDDEMSALICLTDMYSEFPQMAPDYPVIWCSTEKHTKTMAPFGTYLEIDDED